MKIILTGLFSLVIITSYSQTIKELEYELSYFKSGEEWGNKKDIALKLLGIDKLNANAIDYLVSVFNVPPILLTTLRFHALKGDFSRANP